MILKEFQDKFKIKSGLSYLRRTMEKLPVPTVGKKSMAHIGCIVDVDCFENAMDFHQLTQGIFIRPSNVKVIGYKKEATENTSCNIPIFSDKDLGWKGSIHNENVATFLKCQYDILINYYEEDNLILKILSVKTSARFRVGLGTLDPRINDLIVHTSPHDFNKFKNELKKYLNALNEL